MNNDDFKAELDAQVSKSHYVRITAKDCPLGQIGTIFRAKYEHCLKITEAYRLGEIISEEQAKTTGKAHLLITDDYLKECFLDIKAAEKRRLRDLAKTQKIADRQAAKELKVEAASAFGRIAQAKEFLNIQPLHYDKNRIWWAYDTDSCAWSQTDETNILNSIRKGLRIDTIDSTERNEIIEALRQTGRENTPEELGAEWIQFSKTLVNPKTGEQKKASSKYFSCNVIPYEIEESGDLETPNIDRLFTEWVGENYKQTLYEISAYAMSSHQFMQRLIALTGGGCNGKGTFLTFLESVIGESNCVSSDIASLAGSRFATSALYKKLVCFVGEASYDDLRNTNTIKRLSGEDLIQFEFKGKTPFSEKSGCTIIMSTNSLPESPDQSMGFYRRWLIIDFPNQFAIKQNLLDCITDEEKSRFCTKCVQILAKLYTEQRFTNEGTFEERREKYEARSRPLDQFIAECCEEDAGKLTPQRDFSNAFNVWLKSKNLRQLTVGQVGKKLREHGFLTGTRKIGADTSSTLCVLNLSINQQNQQNQRNVNSSASCREMSLNRVGFVGSVGSEPLDEGQAGNISGERKVTRAPSGSLEDFQ